MRGIFAPEFRGYIGERSLVSCSRADILFVALVFGVVAHVLPTVSSAADAPSAFTRVASADSAPAFELSDLTGRAHRLAAKTGRPVAIHFFATWCEACLAELGTLQKFYYSHGDRIDVLAVDVGEVRAHVRSFFETAPVSFPVVLDADRAVTKAWAVDSLPTTVILDQNLKPVLRVSGGLDWTQNDVFAAIERAALKHTDLDN
jgi:thiol-disulfide isomerase/thioredoxin